MKKIVLTVLCILSVTLAYARGGMHRDFAEREAIPAPRLIAPTTDTVNLTGKENLEFKWSPHEGSPTSRDYYDFRLYEGYQELESTLIMKRQVNKSEYAIVLPANTFKSGSVYTWRLRQVYDSGHKGDWSRQSFKVIY